MGEYFGIQSSYREIPKISIKFIKIKGMGFGLSLIKKIIDSYYGEIWVEDRIKGDYTQGSNFVFLISEAIK
jgi:signal transduction histidine kinase